MAFDFKSFGVFGEQPPKEIDFVAKFGHFGVFSARPSRTIEAYNTSVERQIVRLTTNTPPSSGDWFKVKHNCVTVSLRFRGRILPLLDGSNLMRLPSKEIAIQYLQATIDAANEGLFDEVFQEVINTKNPRESTGASYVIGKQITAEDVARYQENAYLFLQLKDAYRLVGLDTSLLSIALQSKETE